MELEELDILIRTKIKKICKNLLNFDNQSDIFSPVLSQSLDVRSSLQARLENPITNRA